MPPQSIYLKIAVPTPLRRTFDYLPPQDALPEQLVPGTRLRIPFGRRSVIGILLDVSATTAIEGTKVRRASAILDAGPAMSKPVLDLCRWGAGYYHHPVGEVFAAALPALLRQGHSLDRQVEELVLTADGEAASATDLPRAPAQAALLSRLQRSAIDRATLRHEEYGRSAVNALIRKGMAQWATRTADITGAFDREDPLAVKQKVTLNQEQQTAISLIEADNSGTTLLFGVTGSGKTEVYLTLIETHLRAGRQALVLVPEIGLTPQTIRRFTERFSVPVTTIHSGLSDRDRLDAWNAARAGACGIIIGTRSAIFCPMAQPGIIIVDEEHDASFKQQDGFRYSARDLAVMRGQMEALPVVLGSATPSFETWHNVNTGKYRIAKLTERATGATLPKYHVINLRDAPQTDGLSRELLERIGGELKRGNQVLVFLNRRGFAPVVLCRSCGWLAHCHRCDARMTLHGGPQAGGGLIRLLCHHCGAESPAPRVCPACETTDLVPLGAGTQRLERTFEGMFGDYPVLRIDRDSTRGRHTMERLLDKVHQGKPAILVGTQLLAKGHHFPHVTLVVIADMDAGFYSANYRAAERMAQLILQVGGRAGREEKPGEVVIQTHLPEQPLFRELIGSGYANFADRSLEERQRHELPPFCHHALLRAEAQNARAPAAFLEDILEYVHCPPSVEMLGPVPATMERKAGKYRYHLLLASDNRKRLAAVLDDCITGAEQSRYLRRVRWAVDVDPLDLF